MTREDQLFKLLNDLTGSVGELKGMIGGVQKTQSEMRGDISNLFDLHRLCSGPRAMEAVEDLRHEFSDLREITTVTKVKKDSDSRISRPPSGGVLISWYDLKIILRALPFVAAVGGTAIGVNQCYSTPAGASVQAEKTPAAKAYNEKQKDQKH